MKPPTWQIHNPDGKYRIIVTKPLPGSQWMERLMALHCRIEICTDKQLLDTKAIEAAIGTKCDGAIGKLTEAWEETLFQTLKNAGGRIYSNYAILINTSRGPTIDEAALVAHCKSHPDFRAGLDVFEKK